jgi:Cu+-exporting ATPase
MDNKILKIEGMTCAACAKAVERASKKLEGVSEANVNLATEKLNISYDSSKVSLEDIQNAAQVEGICQRTFLSRCLYWVTTWKGWFKGK